MNYERVKMIVDLTMAKVEVLKIMSGNESWQCHVDKDIKKELCKVLLEIKSMLKDLQET